jgi:hypothetical protein
MTNPVTEWLWSIALKKGVVAGVTALLAWVGTDALRNFGVTVDPAVLVVGLIGALTTLRNWLKVRWGWAWL